MKKFSGRKNLQKQILASVLALSVVGVCNIAGAADSYLVAEGADTEYTEANETQNPLAKIVGGWNWSQSDISSSDLDKNTSMTNITVNSGDFDEVIGGNHIKQPKGKTGYNVSIGNTAVTLNGGTAEYVVGGSKANNSDNTVLHNANTKMTINDGAFTTIMGGNYIKSTGDIKGGTPAKATSHVIDTEVTITGGVIAGNVYGGSVADNYGDVQTDGKPDLKVNDNNTTLNISGGTFSGIIVGGGAAIGKNSLSSVNTTNLTIAGDNITINNSNGGTRALIFGGSYAEEGSVVVSNTNLILGDENVTTVLTDGTLRVYAGSFNSGVSGKLTTVITNLQNSQGTDEKAQIVGGSRFDEYDIIATDGNIYISVDNSVLNADIRGGSCVFGANNIINAGDSVVNISNSSINGYEKNGSIWPGRIFGGGAVDSTKNSTYNQKNSNVYVNNINGVILNQNTGNVSIDPGARVYGGGQLYSDYLIGSEGNLLNVTNTIVTIDGSKTSLAEVIGGGIISGTVSKDKVNTLVTGNSKVIVNDGYIADFLIGGNNTNWFGCSILGILDDSGEYEYNGHKYSAGSTSIILNGGGNADELYIIGGSMADYGSYYNQNGKREAIVYGKTNVEINDGAASVVIGGGYADYYYVGTIDKDKLSDDAPVSEVIGSTNVNINGGEITNDVIGGGLAYSNQVLLPSKANTTGDTNINITNGTIGGSIISGGLAIGDNTQASVSGTATVDMSGGSIVGDMILGGYAFGENAVAATKKSVLNYDGGNIGGDIVATAETANVYLNNDGFSNALVAETGSTMNIINMVSLTQGNDLVAEGGVLNFVNNDLTAKLRTVNAVDKGQITLGGSDAVYDVQHINVAAESGVTIGDSTLITVDSKFVSNDFLVSVADNGEFVVSPNAKLRILNAERGKEYNIIDGDTEGWSIENISADNFMLQYEKKEDSNDYIITTTVADAAKAFDGAVIIPDVLTQTFKQQNAGDAAFDFFNTAADSKIYTKEQAAKAINNAASMSELAGVSHAAYSVSNILTNAVADHMSLDKNLDHDTDIWAHYVHTKENIDGLAAGNGGARYDAQYNGIVVGADLYKQGKGVVGAALTYIDGKVSGSTRNEAEYYGLSVYGGVQNEDSAVTGDISYLHGKNEITQHNSGYTLTGKPKSDAFSIGVRAEQSFKAGAGKVVPYAGLRYMHLGSGNYTNSIGLHYDADDANLFLLPVGVKYSAEHKTAGWTLRPIAEVGYVWAMGDRDSKQTVSLNGASNGFGYDVTDSGSYIARLALEAERANVTYGLGYEYQKGDSVKANKWMVNLNWAF